MGLNHNANEDSWENSLWIDEHILKKTKTQTNRKYQDNGKWGLPLVRSLLVPIAMQLTSVSGQVGPSKWSVCGTQKHGDVGPGICRKEGIGLERVHTIMQQVFHISPHKGMPHDATDLRTGRSGRWKGSVILQSRFLRYAFTKTQSSFSQHKE